jgi:hypothetical protein
MLPLEIPFYAFSLLLPLVWLTAPASVLHSRRLIPHALTDGLNLRICCLALGVASPAPQCPAVVARALPGTLGLSRRVRDRGDTLRVRPTWSGQV